jgi:hypothetical protein
MYANVQAGPKGIFSKDYLKFKAAAEEAAAKAKARNQ